MILVDVLKEGKGIKEIKIKGHSGYDEIGKDIVCSSVSTAVILTINLLEKLNVDFDYVSDEKIPLISLMVKNVNSNDLVNTLLENLVDNLSKVQEEYNKYLKINIK